MIPFGILCLGIAAIGIASRTIIRQGGIRGIVDKLSSRSFVSPNLRQDELIRRVVNLNNNQYAKKEKEIAEQELLKILENDPYFKGGFEEKMTVDEALLILGLTEEDAKDPKKLHTAHRRIMLRNHPDRGGSQHLATKVNEARDILSKDIGEKPHKYEE